MPRTYLSGVATPADDPQPATKVYVDRYCPVGGRATTYEGTDGTSGTGTTVTTFARTGRTLHRVIGAASALKLEFQNWYTQPNSPGEVNNPNTVTYRAAVEYPAGRWRQISGTTTWSAATSYAALDQVVYSGSSYVALAATTIGTAPTSALGTEWQLVTRYAVTFVGQDANRRVTVTAGGSAVSLPLFLAVVEGQYLAVTTTVSTANAANVFSADIIGTGTGEFALDYPSANPTVGTQDLVDINVTTETSLGTGTRVPMPSAVLGLGRTPETVRSVGLVGDSLIMGWLDSELDSHKKGFAVRAAEYEDVRYRRVPQGGDRMMYWTAANAAKRLALVQPLTSVVCDLGSNDIANSRTLIQMQADAVAAWTEMGRQGARVFQTTITPKTTSTDAWATKANQTPVAPAYATGGVRDTFNAWLRAGASITVNGNTLTMGMSGHPLTGVIDISSAIEDTTDSHYWKSPGWTTDGAHPTAQGYDALAVAMRQYLSTTVLGVPLKHAALHATGSLDPITPASIGAADAATLGGYLPTLTGAGGVSEYILRGELAANIPHWAVNSAYAITTNQVAILLGYSGGFTYTGMRFYVTAAGTATGLVTCYFGSNVAALAKVNSDRTAPLNATGYKQVAFSAPVALAAGYLALLFTSTAATRGSLAALVQSTALPLPMGGQTPSGATGVGTAAATTAPSTLDMSGAGFTAIQTIPWASLY